MMYEITKWVCKRRVILIVTIYSHLIVFHLGCDRPKDKLQSEQVIYAIRHISEMPIADEEIKSRCELALEKWKNGVPDPEPLLFLVVLTQTMGYTDYKFSLVIYDEDQDLEGFVIREEHVNNLGQREIIEETYPVFTLFNPLRIVDAVWFQFHTRNKSDRKDEARWDMHLENKANKTDLDIGNSPPIYISLPDDDKITVWVWLYDKLGNKSNKVKLLNRPSKAKEDENSQGHEK